MQVTREDLKRNYRNKDTEELISLSLQDLTPLAKEVIAEELGKRNISTLEIENFKKEAIIQKHKKDALLNRLASPAARLCGQIIDVFVAMVGLFAIQAIDQSIAFIGVIFFLAYIWLADGLFGGRSIGKLAMRIRVIVEPSEMPCGFWRSFLRNFPASILGIIDWIFIFGEKRQRIGDMIAGTIVVKVA